MNKINLENQRVTIIGGGELSFSALDNCLSHAPTLIAADGGANHLNVDENKIDFIVGDLDSLKNRSFWEKQGTKLLRLAEQDTTDFEKCLYSVDASVYFCIGFTGRRADHFLAACSALVKYSSKKVILVGGHDLIVHVPKNLTIELPLDTRLSLFPMQRLIGIHSYGLKWSIDGIEFEPSKVISTSNSTVRKNVKITLSDDGMLLILPRSCMENVIDALDN